MSIPFSEEKAAIRKEMLAAMKAHAEDAAGERRDRLTENLRSLPEYKAARRILAYLALPGEADLDRFLTLALGEGKEIYIPVCLPGRRMEAGRLLSMAHFRKGPYGLRDLPEGYETAGGETMDLLLVPAVACDRKGRRLGHGAGYYDRYLAGIREDRCMAVLWSFQIVPAVPAAEYDRNMAGFITEEEIYRRPSRRG